MVVDHSDATQCLHYRRFMIGVRSAVGIATRGDDHRNQRDDPL